MAAAADAPKGTGRGAHPELRVRPGGKYRSQLGSGVWVPGCDAMLSMRAARLVLCGYLDLTGGPRARPFARITRSSLVTACLPVMLHGLLEHYTNQLTESSCSAHEP